MINYRNKLIALVFLEIIFILTHVGLRKPENISSIEFEWHFFLALLFGALVIGYAFAIRCPNMTCGKRQVFRSLSIFDLRLPMASNNCYSCGVPLERKLTKSGRIEP